MGYDSRLGPHPEPPCPLEVLLPIGSWIPVLRHARPTSERPPAMPAAGIPDPQPHGSGGRAATNVNRPAGPPFDQVQTPGNHPAAWERCAKRWIFPISMGQFDHR